MSISIGGLGSAFPDPVRPRSDEAAQTPAHGGQLPVPDRAPVAGPDPSASTEEGELWGLLTGEERAYYLRNSITSAATYDGRHSGRASSPSAAGARLGGRLDVRA